MITDVERVAKEVEPDETVRFRSHPWVQANVVAKMIVGDDVPATRATLSKDVGVRRRATCAFDEVRRVIVTQTIVHVGVPRSLLIVQLVPGIRIEDAKKVTCGNRHFKKSMKKNLQPRPMSAA